METWMIWSIFSLFTGGLYNFMFKVIAERGYSTKEVSFYSFSIASGISFFILFFLDGFNLSLSQLPYLVILALMNVGLYFASIISRVESMKNIDTVIFYPIYKTFGPIFITGISVFIFRESLNFTEIIGIVLGICVPLLLLTKAEGKIQKNLKVGVLLVFITAILGTLSAVTSKLVHTFEYNVPFFIFLAFVFGILFSGLALNKENKEERKYQKTGMMKFAISMGIMHYLANLTFNYAIGGNFAVAYTINSFSILIPIILSIIFYGEHFNLKKGIVIALSIVSILLFI